MANLTTKQPRSGTINLRVGAAQKDAIDCCRRRQAFRAAAIQGKSRTEFILDAALISKMK